MEIINGKIVKVFEGGYYINNLKCLHKNIIHEINEVVGYLDCNSSKVLICKIDFNYYFIPKKWEDKFEKYSYIISYGLKKRGDYIMYDLHFFDSYKEAKKYKESKLILTELSELEKCKVHKVSEYQVKKLKFGNTPLAVIYGKAFMLPTRLLNEIDFKEDFNKIKYLVYFGKTKHTSFVGNKYEKHDISFFATKHEAKTSLED